MRQAEGPKPNGIRTIFASAMGVEEAPRRRRFGLADLDGDLLRHVVGGAACGLALVAIATFAVSGGRAAAPNPPVDAAVGGLAVMSSPALAKADRETFHRNEAVIAEIALTSSDRDPLSTVVMPRLAYAVTDPRSDASIAIDTILERPRILVASLATPNLDNGGRSLGSLDHRPIAEDEDDEESAEVVPLPRPRPAIVPLAMPLPKARPAELLAALRPSTTPDEAPAAEVAPARGRDNGAVLGFFSSPSDPVPSPKMRLDTPFGVPFEVQTATVETSCLKPGLVDILRRVESHYHRKAVITSGFRDRGRQGSLHRQCAAVDFEVPGVDAAALAAWVRTMPDVGGVGTYCHPRMIHVDIGAARDWKYGCGSFFAMRGTPGKWGKVPPSLAKLAGAPKPAAQAIAEDEETSTE